MGEGGEDWWCQEVVIHWQGPRVQMEKRISENVDCDDEWSKLGRFAQWGEDNEKINESCFSEDFQNQDCLDFGLVKWVCKSRKSRNTWSNRQIWPWSTDWSRAKTNRVLPRERTGHSKHSLPTTQEKNTQGHHQRLTLKSDWLYSLQPKMEKLYTVSKNKTWSWLWFRSWTPYCQIQT